MLRPDLFTGLRAPSCGLLLYGPPGTGKTLLAKAVACESRATFFSISAASLTSKWMGESEKLVRALFRVAEARAPSIIFIDEIDSILGARSSGEHESSRRLKTEVMVRLDGITAPSAGRVVVLAATNRPQELDDAVIRRLPRRIYVPLPDVAGRTALLRRLLGADAAFALPPAELARLVEQTEGYSGSDLTALCREAAMAPLRELKPEALARVEAGRVRALRLRDFDTARTRIRPSVARESLTELEAWSRRFGSA
jgi:spastin